MCREKGRKKISVKLQKINTLPKDHQRGKKGDWRGEVDQGGNRFFWELGRVIHLTTKRFEGGEVIDDVKRGLGNSGCVWKEGPKVLKTTRHGNDGLVEKERTEKKSLDQGQ